jgi:hypothetical protein
MLSVN